MTRWHLSKIKACLSGLVTIASLAASGCDGGESPADPGNGGEGDNGVGNPVVSTADTIITTVGSDGGTISLPDGTGVFIPAGAVSATTEIAVVRGDPSYWFDGSTQASRAVVEAYASVSQFNTDVDVRIPLPSGMTEADSSRVMAGLIDETTAIVAAQPSSIQIVNGQPYLVIETNHFSSWVGEWLFGKEPPTSAGPFAIPYYNQGPSPYCWAASLHMVTQAVGFDDDWTIPEIIGRMGVDESGITSFNFRIGSTIAEIVRDRAGVDPLRQSWDFVNRNLARDYLWKELGLNGRPVALFHGGWDHAVVVVGYDGSTFYLHDPGSTDVTGVGYAAMTWSEIVAGMTSSHNMVTLAIPASLTSANGPVTVNFVPQAVEFIKPSGGTGDPSAIYRYGWDYTQPTGYSLRHISTGALGDPLPGPVATVSPSSNIQISNASRTAPKTVSAWLDITALGAPSGQGHYSTQKTVSVPANSLRSFTPDDIPVDEFRYNKATTTEYLFTVTALVGGSTVDRHSFNFKIASVTPELTSLQPTTGSAGDVVVIRGKGFGQLAKNNQVLFNSIPATTITSWSDTEIRVQVPAGAATGFVLVKRGEVASNTLPFTVQQWVASGSYTLTWGNSGNNFQVTATVNVTALGGTAGWNGVYQQWSSNDPKDWVKLYFASTEPPSGGSQQFQINVTVNNVSSSLYEGSIAVEHMRWKVWSQTYDGWPPTDVIANPLTLTELDSIYSKVADLYIHVAVTPTDGSPVRRFSIGGLIVSFSPEHAGMG